MEGEETREEKGVYHKDTQGTTKIIVICTKKRVFLLFFKYLNCRAKAVS